MRKEAWCEKGSDHYATATRVAEHKESRPIRQPSTRPVSCPPPVPNTLEAEGGDRRRLSPLSIRRRQVRRTVFLLILYRSYRSQWLSIFAKTTN